MQTKHATVYRHNGNHEYRSGRDECEGCCYDHCSSMESAIAFYDPFQARPLLHIELAYVARYLDGAL